MLQGSHDRIGRITVTLASQWCGVSCIISSFVILWSTQDINHKNTKRKQDLVKKLAEFECNTKGANTVAQLQNIYQKKVDATKAVYQEKGMNVSVLLPENICIDALTSQHEENKHCKNQT